MGTFTDNLLKLTEFPFSYSLIGLLTLIFGEGLNLEEASLAKLGPLLILMGFVATTLSITDPVGALQKLYLDPYAPAPSMRFRFSRHPIGRFFYKLATRVSARKLGEEELARKRQALRERYDKRLVDSVVGAIIFGHSTIEIPWPLIISLSRHFEEIFRRGIVNYYTDRIQKDSSIRNTLSPDGYPTVGMSPSEFYDEATLEEISLKIRYLKRSTLQTTWVVHEIDKITAMGYFIIIVSIFISAELLIPHFLDDKFLFALQGADQARGAGQNSTTGTNAATSAALGDGSLVRIIIIVFSFIALGTVSYMLLIRLGELKSKAWTTFRYLASIEAIKIDKTMFDKSLKEIEQYLSNGHWTMADYWVRRVIVEYSDLLIGIDWKKERKAVREDETKDIEKKIMIKWRNGEMSVEEVKDK